MDTKLKADIAESAVIAEFLKKGFNVLKPIGDRLPYDLAVDISGKLIRIQVKSAWFYRGAYKIDVRMTKTNRRRIKRKYYSKNDFDFAVIYIQDLNVFYIMPQYIFNSYKSEISLVEDVKRQRKPKSAMYRENWSLVGICQPCQASLSRKP